MLPFPPFCWQCPRRLWYQLNACDVWDILENVLKFHLCILPQLLSVLVFIIKQGTVFFLPSLPPFFLPPFFLPPFSCGRTSNAPSLFIPQKDVPELTVHCPRSYTQPCSPADLHALWIIWTGMTLGFSLDTRVNDRIKTVFSRQEYASYMGPFAPYFLLFVVLYQSHPFLVKK